MASHYLRWSEVPYGGEKSPPANPIDPKAGTWPTYYIKRVGDHFVGPDGEIIKPPRDPHTIDWEKELSIVKNTLNNITKKQIKIARYWGTGAPTKQWTPIIDRLIDTYNLTPVHAARVWAAVEAGTNDSLIAVWYYKYLWDVARPIQYDQELEPILCTPGFPTYVSGHAAVAGCAQIILSYFFPGKANRLRNLAKEAAKSRLYAGVHFPIDNKQGLQLGRAIGTSIVNVLKNQRNIDGNVVDIPYSDRLHAKLQPPPYKQALPYPFEVDCTSNTRTQQ